MMETLGEAINALENDLFTDREAEMAAFHQWLEESGPPEILSIVGRSGIGKSALLRHFERSARRLGWHTRLIDGQDVATADLVGTGGPDRPRSVDYRSPRPRTLILLDTLEEFGDWRRFLRDDLLGHLPADAKLVIAGRYPLTQVWAQGASLSVLVRMVQLDRLSQDDSTAYLRRRGIQDETVMAEVNRLAQGNPLALALSADLIVQLGTRDFITAPERHLLIRTLVDRLLRDAPSTRLQRLIEAGAVVRHFDETILAAVSGLDNIAQPFAQLCRLSIVRPSHHGLTFHSDVRQILLDDLQWRHPARYHDLRRRAQAHYRSRMATATPEERAHLVTEQLFLWTNSLVQTLLFRQVDSSRLWLEPALPPDHSRIRQVWQVDNRGLGAGGSHSFEVDRAEAEFLDAVLAQPAARVRIVRSQSGEVRGFNAALPVTRDTLPILARRPAQRPLINALWDDRGPESLSASSAEPVIWFLCHLRSRPEDQTEVLALLLGDWFGLLAQGGTYLAITARPESKTLFEACQFERIAAATNWSWGPPQPIDGYRLDLSKGGVEGWIEQILGEDSPVRGQPLAAAGAEPESAIAALDRLTARERQIVQLVARGYTSRRIATELTIAERTADTHIDHIRAKLGLRSRVQIVAWAAATGLV